MPYGHELFVMRLSPRHPGYVMTVWAAAKLDVITANNMEDNIVKSFVLVGRKKKKQDARNYS